MFNEVLEAYGLKLSVETAKNVPTSYAKVEGDTIMFTDKPFAYTPEAYHSILIAYGLVLSAEKVSDKYGSIGYASVKDGKIVFGKNSVAYNPEEWKTILSAYSKAM
jgi:hypothetical protein